MNDTKIEYASSIRFLGVIIDGKIKILTTYRFYSSNLSNIRVFCINLKNWYPTLPYYIYIIALWSRTLTIAFKFGNASPTRIHPLEVAQKRYIRIIANEP